jgi:hypothetical protein
MHFSETRQLRLKRLVPFILLSGFRANMNPAWRDAPRPGIVASRQLSRCIFGHRRNKDRGPRRSHRAHPRGRDQRCPFPTLFLNAGSQFARALSRKSTGGSGPAPQTPRLAPPIERILPSRVEAFGTLIGNRLRDRSSTILQATRSLANDRLLNPELVHSDKRIRIVGLKACPVAQIGAARIIGKARTVLS